MPEFEKSSEVSTATTQVLEILQIRGVGVAMAREVLREAASSGESELLSILSRRSKSARSVSPAALQAARRAAEQVISSCRALRVYPISMIDPIYPPALKEIEDAPPVLYVKGQPSALIGPAAAVVGTRDATPRGKFAASTIGKTLAELGVCVVSGLALGIDTAAHTGVLLAKGTTVAILAHGLDTVTPASNQDLADRILAQGGALVSEHPPGTPPRKAEYVRRNRIQSGMSMLSIVVESGESGGSIHQASFARDQRRPLYVVYPDPSTEKQFTFAGADILIAKLGAKPLSGTRDLRRIIEEVMKTRSASPPQSQTEIRW